MVVKVRKRGEEEGREMWRCGEEKSGWWNKTCRKIGGL